MNNNLYINLQNLNQSYSEKARKVSNASASSLFIYDRDLSQPVKYLHVFGVKDGIIRDYFNGVHRYDPALQLSTEQKDEHIFSHVNDINRSYDDMRIQKLHQNYWDAFASVGFRETSNCVARISKNMYLVAGLILTETDRKKGKHLQVERAMNTMDGWFDSLKDFLIETSIRETYSGYKALNLDFSETSAEQQLTRRELQVVNELRQGKTNKQISKSLFISEYTVENHLRNIYQKLGVRNRLTLITHLQKH